MHQNDKIEPNLFERSQSLTQEFFDVPLLGMVRLDIDSYTHGDYNLSELVSNFQSTDQNAVTLEVLDDAMQKAGIFKGDFLTIDLRLNPRDGNIVVVKLGERFYIRRFFKNQNLIRLETADDYPSSIVIEPDTPGFQFLGKVISLSRQF